MHFKALFWLFAALTIAATSCNKKEDEKEGKYAEAELIAEWGFAEFPDDDTTVNYLEPYLSSDDHTRTTHKYDDIYYWAYLYYYGPADSKTEAKDSLIWLIGDNPPDNIKYAMYQRVERKRVQIVPIWRRFGQDPTPQLHITAEVSGKFRHPLLYLEQPVDPENPHAQKMYIHTLAYKGEGGNLYPIFVGADLTEHIGYNIPDHKHPQHLDYLGYSIGIDNPREDDQFQSFLEDLRLLGIGGGGDHISQDVHCHNPINGKVIPDCGDDRLAAADTDARDSDAETLALAPYTSKQRMFKFYRNGFPHSKELTVILPPANSRNEELARENANALEKADIMGFTYLVPKVIDGVSRPFPEQIRFFAFNPEYVELP